MSREELKAKSKQDIQGRIPTFLMGIVVIGLISGVINKFAQINYIISVIVSVALMVLNYGLMSMFLKTAKSETIEIGDIFIGFKDFVRIGLTLLLQSFYMVCWSLLFAIPGFVKMYSYALTPYILMDHPGLSYNDAITRSRQLMDGHKMELFILDLSFIGWILATILTCGIASIYVYPYIGTARANFYLNINR